MNSDWQQQVIQAFNAGAKNYHQLAQVQQRIADGFFEWMQLPPAVDTILDVGCGSGFLTQRIMQQFPQATVFALDAAPEMLKWLDSMRLQPLCADFDAIPLEDESCDVICSSLSLQWSRHPQQTLAEWLRVLKKGGRLYFATLLTGTLVQWDECWQALGDEKRSNHLLSLQQLQATALPTDCEWVRVSTETVTHYYPTVQEALASVREIGAGKRLHSAKIGLMGRQKWQSFLAAYENRRTECGLPLSYEVMYGAIEKK